MICMQDPDRAGPMFACDDCQSSRPLGLQTYLGGTKDSGSRRRSASSPQCGHVWPVDRFSFTVASVSGAPSRGQRRTTWPSCSFRTTFSWSASNFWWRLGSC